MKSTFQIIWRKALMLFSGLIGLLSILAFDPPEPPPITTGNCANEMSYVTDDQTYFRLPSGVELGDITQIDIENIQPYSTRAQTTTCVDANNQITTTRILLASENVYEDWMTQSYRTVSDANGVQVFDKNGNLLNSFPSSDEGIQAKQDMVQLFIESCSQPTEPIPVFTEEYIEELRTMGYSVNIVGPNTVEVSRIEGAERYIYTSTTVTMFYTVTDVDFTYDFEVKYITLPSGNIVPEYTQTTSTVDLYSGHCAKKIQRVNYSEYNLEGPCFTNAGASPPASFK